jgi:mono/diheme cytochrome c family protein
MSPLKFNKIENQNMKNTSVLLVTLIAVAGSASAAEVDLSKLPPPSSKEGVTFATDIKPIFQASCVRCHGDQRPKAGLRLDGLEAALQGSKDGKVIIPGKSTESDLVIAVSRLDPKKAMPPQQRPGQTGNRPGAPGAAPGGAASGARTNAAAGARPNMPPPAKPLTAEQVGLIRAWIDQGAK